MFLQGSMNLLSCHDNKCITRLELSSYHNLTIHHNRRRCLMAEKKKTNPAEIDKPIEYEVPMDWKIPDGLVSRYANQSMVVTQEFEYIISFYESNPPILMAKTQEELHEMAKGVKSLPAECVARIIVA